MSIALERLYLGVGRLYHSSFCFSCIMTKHFFVRNVIKCCRFLSVKCFVSKHSFFKYNLRKCYNLITIFFVFLTDDSNTLVSVFMNLAQSTMGSMRWIGKCFWQKIPKYATDKTTHDFGFWTRVGSPSVIYIYMSDGKLIFTTFALSLRRLNRQP